MAENVNAADQAQALPAQRIEATDLGFAQGDALRVEDVTRILHVSRNTVYKLARTGELPSYRVGRQMRFRYDDVRARLESVAASQETKAAIASGADEPSDVPVPSDVLDEVPSWMRGSIVVGGQEIVADMLANYLAGLGVKALRCHTNDYMSLARMYIGGAHAAVVGLWSERDCAYNAPYLRTLLPGVPAISFRLFKRKVGFTVAAGNPLGLYEWGDLLKPGVVIANRERGAGPRVLLDEKLKYLEARADVLAGYDRPAASELAQALMVSRGLANVAVTSAKPARQLRGLEFVPMQDETVDLVVLKTPATASFIKAARSLLRTAAFRSEFDAAVYETRLMGEPVYEC